MNQTLSQIKKQIKLSSERVTRSYIAEISSEIIQGKKKYYNAIGLEFDLTFYGLNEDGLLKYTLNTTKRFLLNEKFNIIKKHSKAQQIALKAASINNTLAILVNKNFKLISITNTEEIRSKWQEVKSDLLKEFPDLSKMVEDLDWQLQEDHIQQVFLEDNFFSFLFADVFNQDFLGKEVLVKEKSISNALDTISIPIKEQRNITKQDMFFSKATISMNGDMHTKDENFPLAKLNIFLGKLPTEPNSQHSLKFKYAGTYQVKPQEGLVTEGHLEYSFDVKDVYTKNSRITFNLQHDE
ncbi:hypothetical protein [Ascidiimonas sp. W6]|uniref:hypothetical protein n=1 Tax=Ascidiimonas meishanensis TaxID=3128903 RepID=UPI0030EF29B0